MKHSSTNRIAFLSMDGFDHASEHDVLTYAPLAALGWEVHEIPWRAQDTDWADFAAVVVRSTWDYQNDIDAFLACLKKIEQSPARLFNPLSLIEWNLRKTYLRELQTDGHTIVPTQWLNDPSPAQLRAAFEHFGAQEMVFKPVVSASAQDTFRVARGASDVQFKQLAVTFRARQCMAQPLMQSIIQEGEFSLFYFSGRYSHCIVKAPADGDFRVQEELGGILTPAAVEPALAAQANAVLQSLHPEPLYARIDFVRNLNPTPTDEPFMLMEVELIEPSLYFRLCPDGAKRFAQALDKQLRHPTENPRVDESISRANSEPGITSTR